MGEYICSFFYERKVEFASKYCIFTVRKVRPEETAGVASSIIDVSSKIYTEAL